MKASELLVRCLEHEGVRHVFGVPGEENLDVMDALLDSSIRFVTTRHEQGAAFMADVQGRLTGRAGVCLATLGPGATNLLTGVVDAYPTALRSWRLPDRFHLTECTRSRINTSMSDPCFGPARNGIRRSSGRTSSRKPCGKRSRWRRPKNPVPRTWNCRRMWLLKSRRTSVRSDRCWFNIRSCRSRYRPRSRGRWT